jgi:hypothetical protein
LSDVATVSGNVPVEDTINGHAGMEFVLEWSCGPTSDEFSRTCEKADRGTSGGAGCVAGESGDVGHGPSRQSGVRVGDQQQPGTELLDQAPDTQQAVAGPTKVDAVGVRLRLPGEAGGHGVGPKA